MAIFYNFRDCVQYVIVLTSLLCAVLSCLLSNVLFENKFAVGGAAKLLSWQINNEKKQRNCRF